MKVLIVGAGIAGPTLAFWLNKSGHEVTIVEHAPELRSGGYLIDFWGAGFDVAERMGIVPELRTTGDNAPSHRVLVGRAEIGAAWSKRSNEGREYLGLKLDDPSFNAPIYANLFDDEDGESHSLIWSRPNGRRSD